MTIKRRLGASISGKENMKHQIVDCFQAQKNRKKMSAGHNYQGMPTHMH